MAAFMIPGEYGYVMLVAAAVYILNFAQMFRVIQLRNKYNIEYPLVNSEIHEDYQRAQRVHANTLENQPLFFILLTFSGLKYPIYAAAFGLVFLVARIVYSIGYYMKASWRAPGSFLTIFGAMMPLTGLTIASAGNILEWF